ncbi:MAG: PQQ-dependent sugar dehydrogenase, partial [bacterium]
VLDEIFAYGFRNPWRMSFDGTDFYVADVGQNHVEEVDLVVGGEHYGWSYKEGSFYFLHNDGLPGYVTTEEPVGLPPIDFIDPVFEYDHGEGISVIGGRVYRGVKIPGLIGKYVFGDFLKRLFVGDPGTGEIKAIDIDVDFFVYSFITDSEGELYVTGIRTSDPFPGTSGSDGVVLKLSRNELCFPVKRPLSKAIILCL